MIEVQECEGVGRILVAIRDIAPDEEIFKDSSACHGPRQELLKDLPVCIQCLESEVKNIKKCEKCQITFCSECLTIADQFHNEECSIFKKFINIPWKNKIDIVTPLRLYLAMKSDDNLFNQVSMLMDHELERKKDKQHWEQSQQLIKLVVKTLNLNQDNQELFSRCIGYLHVNSLSTENLLGRILFPTFSILSHSCRNNAKHVLIWTKTGFEIR